MKKKIGCIRHILLVLLAFGLLYFTVGEGKTYLLKKIYPTKYQEHVEKYALEYSLDKNLIYAVIKVESNFDEKAISLAGANGLMQLMEETALECNEKAGFAYNIPSDLFVPECNIRLGCYYINHLVNLYDDVEMAIIAYNGGTGNVRKWLSDPSLLGSDGRLEKIPYEETRKYVKKVFKTFEMYNRLYKINE